MEDHCAFGVSYTEGSSLKGYEVEDILWLGTENIEQSIKQYMTMAVPMTFGCELSEKGLIADQYADGIMGLSWVPNNEDKDNDDHQAVNIITKMYQDGVIPNHAFSICMTRYKGILSLGGTALHLYSYLHPPSNNENQKRRTHLREMKMVPISKSNGYYSIEIEDFHIGGIPVQKSKQEIMSIFNERKGTIIDSGTSDTYLPKGIQSEFNTIWKTLANSYHSNNIRTYTKEEFQKLPNITFTLQGGHTWTIEPDQYMEPVEVSLQDRQEDENIDDWTTKEFYNRIYVDEPIGAVLGANAMFGHDVLFDIGNRRIGIARANCS